MTLPTRTRLFLGAATILGAACIVCAGISLLAGPGDRDHRRRVANDLGLTDLAIWYEAMHTRHPSQSDMFAPFGDFPGSPEHFPSGSMAPPSRESGFYAFNLEPGE